MFRAALFVSLFLLSATAFGHNPKDQQCLALAMYWEARGEGTRGMEAVGSVVLNRVDDRRFPNNTCNVVMQGGERPPCQFSWWCDGKSDRPKNYQAWDKAMRLADSMLHGRRGDPTRGALFFHSTSVSPGWERRKTTRIGNHIFYR